jgi:predicted RNase H-like HicB family nuclease
MVSWNRENGKIQNSIAFPGEFHEGDLDFYRPFSDTKVVRVYSKGGRSMDPLNNLGAKAPLITPLSERKTSQKEDLAEALRNAKSTLYRAQDDMMEHHQETVKKGLEENKKAWKKRSREEALDKAQEQQEEYFKARSREAEERERELSALLLSKDSKSSENQALLLEKRALEEEDPTLLLAARERQAHAAREAAAEEDKLRQAQSRKDQRRVL